MPPELSGQVQSRPERSDDRRDLVRRRGLLQLAQQAGGLARETSGATCPTRHGEYDAGMTIPADALQAHRLPPADRGGMGIRLPGGHDHQPVLWSLGPTCSRLMPGIRPTATNMPGPAAACCPTTWGLFDMLGNVYEWCQERYPNDPPGIVNSPDAEILDIRTSRALRGGAFLDRPALIRSAYRIGLLPAINFINSGFRLARTYN